MLRSTRVVVLGVLCWVCLSACTQAGPDTLVPTFSADAALTQVVQTAGLEPTAGGPQPAATEQAAGAGQGIGETAGDVTVEVSETEPVHKNAGTETADPTEATQRAVGTAGPNLTEMADTPAPPADAGTPASATPPATPTLGPKGTRTPGAPGLCPDPSDQWPAIEPIEPGESITDGFQYRILAFLNAGGPVDDLRGQLEALTIEDGTGSTWLSKAQAMSVDVTGNATPDVVVSLVFFVEGQFAEGALYVFSCRDAEYNGGAAAPLFGQVLTEIGPDPGIRAIQDMNGNGVNDIAVSYIEMIGTHANFTRLFRVLEWDGIEFASLVEGDSAYPDSAPVLNGDGAIYDTNGNRNLELVLSNQPSRGTPDGGPQRVKTDVWAWTGYAFKPFKSEYEPASYRFQAVQDGDEAAIGGRLDSAMTFYQQAINDDSLLGWQPGQTWTEAVPTAVLASAESSEERVRLTAYALYRILLVQALQGEPDAAEGTLMLLRDQYPDGGAGASYANLAEAFWQGFSPDQRLEFGCRGAQQHAAEYATDILEPLGSSVYGFLNRDYTPLDICPFAD